MTHILLCYLAALIICAACFAAIYIILKKAFKIQTRWAVFFGGVLFALAYYAGVMLLFQATFRTQQYYNTTAFRTLVGLVFLLLFCFARFLILHIFFFRQDREQQAFSFAFGFGFAPAAFLAAYLLIMSLVIAFNGIFNGPAVMEESGLLSFEDNTIISVFRPVLGHVSVALLFCFAAVLSITLCWFMRRISTRDYHPAIRTIWLILLLLVESAAVLPVPFMKMYGLAHWQLPLIAAAAAGVNLLLVRMMPGERKTPHYSKQFE